MKLNKIKNLFQPKIPFQLEGTNFEIIEIQHHYLESIIIIRIE